MSSTSPFSVPRQSAPPNFQDPSKTLAKTNEDVHWPPPASSLSCRSWMVHPPSYNASLRCVIRTQCQGPRPRTTAALQRQPSQIHATNANHTRKCCRAFDVVHYTVTSDQFWAQRYECNKGCKQFESDYMRLLAPKRADKHTGRLSTQVQHRPIRKHSHSTQATCALSIRI